MSKQTAFCFVRAQAARRSRSGDRLTAHSGFSSGIGLPRCLALACVAGVAHDLAPSYLV